MFGGIAKLVLTQSLAKKRTFHNGIPLNIYYLRTIKKNKIDGKNGVLDSNKDVFQTKEQKSKINSHLITVETYIRCVTSLSIVLFRSEGCTQNRK